MTLLKLESFDGVATVAQFANKWSTLTDPNVASLTGGRTGDGITGTGAFGLKQNLGSNEHATLIVGFGISLAAQQFTDQVRILELRGDAGATLHGYLQVLNDKRIQYVRGDGTVLGSSSAVVLGSGNFYFVEAKVVLHDTTGSVRVRVEGIDVIVLNNVDTKNAGTEAVFDQVAIGTSAFAQPIWDDFYICNGAGSTNNDFLGDIVVECLRPTGNGTYSEMMGSDGNTTDNYLLVDEENTDTADYVASDSNGERQSFAYGNLVSSGDIAGVQLVNFIVHQGSIVLDAVPFARLSTTDLDAAVYEPTNDYVMVERVFETKPGGGAWTVTNVNDAEFGIRAQV